MVYILSRLSQQSKDALSGKPGFEIAKYKSDTRAVWDMVLQTHKGSSARSKLRSLVDLVGSHQAKLPFSAFMADFRAKAV